MVEGATILGLSLYTWLLKYGYAVMIPLFLVEGLTTSITAGILASLGVFNIFTLFVVFSLAEFVRELFLYFVARYSIDTLKKFTLTRKMINRIEKNSAGSNRESIEFFKKNPVKIIVLAKSAPIIHLPTTIVLASGMLKIPLKKFILGLAIGQPIWSAMVLGAGYYFGRTATNIQFALSLVGIIMISILLVLFLYFKFAHKYIMSHTIIGIWIHGKKNNHTTKEITGK